MTAPDCYARGAMAQQGAARTPSPQGDPWRAFGYVVSGVLVYGSLGWVADRWLGTTFLVAIGVVLGAGFGVYLTWKRFGSVPGSIPIATKTDHETTQEKQ